MTGDGQKTERGGCVRGGPGTGVSPANSVASRAEFFQRLGYAPNERQLRLHAALAANRFIYTEFPYQSGLTTALLHEALYRAEATRHDALLCVPNNFSRSLEVLPRLRALAEPAGFRGARIYYGRELSFDAGGRLMVLTPGEARTMARGWKLAAAFCDDASFGGEWNWRDLEAALCQLNGPAAVGVSTGRPGFSAHTLWPQWWRKLMAAAGKEGNTYAEVLE